MTSKLRTKTNWTSKKKTNIICITETWFDEESQIILPSYKFHFQNRGARGVGVAIYTINNIIASEVQINILNSTEIEQIWRIISIGKENIFIGEIYRPQDRNDENLTQIMRELEFEKNSLLSLGCSVLLVGGYFNFMRALIKEEVFQPLDTFLMIGLVIFVSSRVLSTAT